MTDPLGLINSTGAFGPVPASARLRPPVGPAVPGSGSDMPAGGFRALLENQIAQVNELQNDADTALEDLAAGRRDDLENVILATQKADTAFRMLLQVRNKMMDAYEEVKQIRV